MKESLLLSAFYIAIGLAFGGWIWFQSGQQPALEYLTGFVIEKSLAMDNIFVIAMIFSYFAIPRQYQHRVLLYGILGVLVLRGIMIAGGAAIVENFHGFLRPPRPSSSSPASACCLPPTTMPKNLEDNRLLKFLRRRLPVTNTLHGESFVVRQPDPATGKLKKNTQRTK